MLLRFISLEFKEQKTKKKKRDKKRNILGRHLSQKEKREKKKLNSYQERCNYKLKDDGGELFLTKG